MRERLRRRVREAFREALKQEGYDSKGKVLRPDMATTGPSRDLKGTLELTCQGRAGLDCEFGEMVEYAKHAVSAVVQSSEYNNRRLGFHGTEWWNPNLHGYQISSKKRYRREM